MSSWRMEAFLAKIYVDAKARQRFLNDPRGMALQAGLNEEEVVAVEKIDRVGLELMARSLNRKHRGGNRKKDEL